MTVVVMIAYGWRTWTHPSIQSIRSLEGFNSISVMAKKVATAVVELHTQEDYIHYRVMAISYLLLMRGAVALDIWQGCMYSAPIEYTCIAIAFRVSEHTSPFGQHRIKRKL